MEATTKEDLEAGVEATTKDTHPVGITTGQRLLEAGISQEIPDGIIIAHETQYRRNGISHETQYQLNGTNQKTRHGDMDLVLQVGNLDRRGIKALQVAMTITNQQVLVGITTDRKGHQDSLAGTGLNQDPAGPLDRENLLEVGTHKAEEARTEEVITRSK